MTAAAQHIDTQEPEQVPPKAPAGAVGKLVKAFEKRQDIACTVDDNTITVASNGGNVVLKRCECRPTSVVDDLHPDEIENIPLGVRVAFRALCGRGLNGTKVEPLLRGTKCWAGDGRTGLRVGQTFFEFVSIEPEVVIDVGQRYVSPYSREALEDAQQAGES